jgi:hypothetical protein
MKLPSDIASAVVAAAGKELAATLAGTLEDLQLFTISDVAARLRVSEPKARALVREYVELGEASKRVSARVLRQLIADRTVAG